jgi:hypothetical protein
MKVHISPPLQQEHLVAAALVPEDVADFLSRIFGKAAAKNRTLKIQLTQCFEAS